MDGLKIMWRTIIWVIGVPTFQILILFSVKRICNGFFQNVGLSNELYGIHYTYECDYGLY